MGFFDAHSTGFDEETLNRAEREVRYLVGDNPVTDEDAYYEAVLAAAGAIGEAAMGTGMSIGSFRVSGRRTQAPAQAAQQAALKVLAPTGMVYAGLA